MESLRLMDDKKTEKADYNNYHSRKSFDIEDVRKAIKATQEEVKDVSEYLRKGEFEQYEKRIDEKFENLNSKIDALPKIFEDKLEIALGKRAEDERRERKDDKKSIIGWSISGTSLIIAFLGILGKAFGWF